MRTSYKILNRPSPREPSPAQSSKTSTVLLSDIRTFFWNLLCILQCINFIYSCRNLPCSIYNRVTINVLQVLLTFNTVEMSSNTDAVGPQPFTPDTTYPFPKRFTREDVQTFLGFDFQTLKIAQTTMKNLVQQHRVTGVTHREFPALVRKLWTYPTYEPYQQRYELYKSGDREWVVIGTHRRSTGSLCNVSIISVELWTTSSI